MQINIQWLDKKQKSVCHFLQQFVALFILHQLNFAIAAPFLTCLNIAPHLLQLYTIDFKTDNPSILVQIKNRGIFPLSGTNTHFIFTNYY